MGLHAAKTVVSRALGLRSYVDDRPKCSRPNSNRGPNVHGPNVASTAAQMYAAQL